MKNIFLGILTVMCAGNALGQSETNSVVKQNNSDSGLFEICKTADHEKFEAALKASEPLSKQQKEILNMALGLQRSNYAILKMVASSPLASFSEYGFKSRACIIAGLIASIVYGTSFVADDQATRNKKIYYALVTLATGPISFYHTFKMIQSEEKIRKEGEQKVKEFDQEIEKIKLMIKMLEDHPTNN